MTVKLPADPCFHTHRRLLFTVRVSRFLDQQPAGLFADFVSFPVSHYTYACAVELAAQRLFSSFRPVDGFSLVIVDLLGEILWKEDIGVFGDLPASLIGAGWPRFRLLTQRRLLGNHREFRRDNLQSVWRLEFA